MSNPFAAIETALAVSVTALSNATARISGILVDGIHDSRYADRLGIASSGPAFTARTADLPDDVTFGSTVTLTYKGTTTAYTVAEVQPDGAGVTVLLLK